MSLRISTKVVELIDAASGAKSAAEIGRSFFAALQPYGVRAIFARAYRSASPGDEHIFSRISPAGWEAMYDERRLVGADFVSREVRRRGTPFAWSEIHSLTPDEQELMAALPAFDITGGLAAPVHGPGGYVGVTSLAFRSLPQLSPEERGAIQMAALVLHQRMLALTPSAAKPGPALSPRERDCLAFVAAGRTDWEISEILGIAETTVLTHVQNARRKLGAKTRAHAVALSVLAGLL